MPFLSLPTIRSGYVVLFWLFMCIGGTFAQLPTREVAVTIDDLPVVSTRRDLRTRRDITKKLLGHIRKARVPAVGFVNENKLYTAEKRDEAQVDLLRMWLDAGMELGNHTYSHRSLNAIPLQDYQDDILKGEIITGELMKERNRVIRYFRHPFLQTGLTMEAKTGLDAFLRKRNYTIAPVTFDNSEWIFARAYDNAFDNGDKGLMARVGVSYIEYLDKKTDYWERQSKKLFGREPKQILLLHANFLNSDYFDDVALMLSRRGYKFIPLEEALKAQVYLLPDRFTGRAGISWLHRWARDRGREFVLPDEPRTPEFVMKAAGVESE